MAKLLLIDGHSILSRAYYGLPGLRSSDGTPTGAVHGFLSIMLKCIDEEKADYVAAAFDKERAKLRRLAVYPEYKGTRKPMPEDLLAQVPITLELLRAMDIPVYALEGYEADDILGTLAGRAEAEGLDVTIVSGDRDLLQLCSERTAVSIPRTTGGRTEVRHYHADDVVREYGVTPAEFIEMKALMGDSSDNVPGLPGVGEKTAGEIMRRFHSLSEARKHADEVTPPRARKALMEHFDLALLSLELVTIDTAVPIEADVRAGRTDAIYSEQALALLRKLELRSLAGRFAAHTDTAAHTSASLTVSPKEVTDPYMAAIILKDAASEELIAFAIDNDTPSGGVAIALVLSPQRVYVIRSGDEYPADSLKADFVSLLSGRIAACKKSVTIDLKNQLKSIEIAQNKEIFDLAIALYLMEPGRSSYGYELIARRFLARDIEPSASQRPALSALTAYLSFAPASQRLREEGTWQLFSEVETPLIYTLDRMEKTGIAVDAAALDELAVRFKEEMDSLESEVTGLAGEDFNINSPKQLGHILFEKLGIRGGKKTKTGYSTSADVLEKVRYCHPIVDKILRYRAVSKLYSTYARGLRDCISPDGRIHGTFNQTIAATGRLTSTEPNLQNIPVRTAEGREIRRVFVPGEGRVFVDADFSQVELRVLAALSGDETLMAAYAEGSDIHALTASMVFHTPLDRVTPEMRRSAKAVNFGIVYGISAFGLGEDLAIGRKEAADYIERYFETYPRVREYLDETVRTAKEQGLVRTYFGRIRPVPELKSSNYAERSFGERIAMNSPIQGTAADIMKIAMLRAFDALTSRGLKSRLVLQVHDELLVETEPDEVEQVREILRDAMEHAADIGVPLAVDIGIGKSWYECH